MKDKAFVWADETYGYRSVSGVGIDNRGGRLGDIGNRKRMRNNASIGCIGCDKNMWGIEQVSSTGKIECTVSAIGNYLTGDIYG